MKKGCLRLFNKKHLYMLDQAQNSEIFSICQATYQKKLCLFFEKQAKFFHTAKVQIGLTPLLFVSVPFLKIPLSHSTANVLFECLLTRIFCKVWLQLITLLQSVTIANVMLWYFSRLSELSGDIEFNPGSKPDPSQSFSICHWSLKSISAHKYFKISLLIAYISIYNFDIICLIYKHILTMGI